MPRSKNSKRSSKRSAKKPADKYTAEQRSTFVIQPENAVNPTSPVYENTRTTTENF